MKTATDRKALLAVAAELNEKRDAEIEVGKKATTESLIDAILESTDNGSDLKKLTKATREVIQAIVDSRADDGGEGKGEGSDGEADGNEGAGTDGEDDLTSREHLNIAAADLNEVMGLEPGIDTTADDKVFMKAFKKAVEMATSTDSFSDHTWDVFAALGIGPERAKKNSKPAGKAPKADKADKKPAGKPEKAEKKAKPEKAPKASKEPKGPGVIATIIDFIDSAKGKFTRDDIHAALVKAFPDRDESSLMATIKTQVPGRLSKERGYTFTKDAKDPNAFTAKPPKK